MKEAISSINYQFEQYMSNGSGWILTNIENVKLMLMGMNR